MNEESITALKDFDRAHPMDPSVKRALELQMLAVMDEELAATAAAEASNSQDGSRGELIRIDLAPLEDDASRPAVNGRKGPQRFLPKMFAAAAVVLIALAVWPSEPQQSTVQISADERPSEETGGPFDMNVIADPATVVLEFCRESLDPLGVALDASRVNPTEENAQAVERALELAIRRLDDAIAEGIDPWAGSEARDLAQTTTNGSLNLDERLRALVAIVDGKPGSDDCRLERFDGPLSVSGDLSDPAQASDG